MSPKKRNILVSNTGHSLLCDFGLSRIRHELSLTSTTIRQGGNNRFIAPEISPETDEIRVNEQSDIYSLAMTIYALGTKSPPFKDMKPHRARNVAAKGERPSKHDSLGGLTAEHTDLLWSLLERMWSQDPQLRPTVITARDEIAECGITSLVGYPILFASPTHTLHSPTDPSSRSRTRWTGQSSYLPPSVR